MLHITQHFPKGGSTECFLQGLCIGGPHKGVPWSYKLEKLSVGEVPDSLCNCAPEVLQGLEREGLLRSFGHSIYPVLYHRVSLGPSVECYLESAYSKLLHS